MAADSNTTKRILIADDDPVSLRILQKLLEKWGYEVTSVCNGADALRILRSDDTPRLALLDWMMPGMDGVEVCRQIRLSGERPYIYALLLTARSEKQDVLRGFELGADDYLTKPFDSHELRARLHVGHRILQLQDHLIATQEQLQFRATHDALTEVYNRGAMFDAVRRELARQKREKKPFGLILADVDHFKRINDVYGHLCGDSVLREVARRMQGSLRPYDMVGRYGGEEFLILAPIENEAAAVEIAERVRRSIADQLFTTDGGDLPVTASFGVTVSDETQDANDILQLADKALYRSKEKGRNRTEVLLPEPTAVGASPVRD